ncbi:hypothetical protein [Bacillus sp. ISL-39]|uniref:hypothetical protein n=1 Tax=Bacillus sp. ISL-39 TaxID=2819124 RepID=UPI001BE7F5E9|nr:hypothetical protein [Bacillus sp. ISL-39]MBT2639849.1 hypothetical protein [Bacillus sp. ISL-39]
MNISLVTTLLIPIFIPFISIYVASIITKKQNEKEMVKSQQTQRIKLLTLLKKEAEMYKDYRLTNNMHRSKEFLSTNLIISSPVFNVEEHAELIELALEMERINQNLDIVLNTSTALHSAILGGYLSNLSTGNPLMTLANSKLMKLINGKTQVEKVAAGLEVMYKKSIEESTKESLPIINKIILETDRLLKLEFAKPKRSYGRND